MRRQPRILTLIATMATVAAAALGTAGTAHAGVVGLQDDQLPNYVGQPLVERLDLLAATKTRTTRVDVLWDQVAPTRPADAGDPADPAYRWGRYDAIFRGLAQRDITPIVDFYRTPPWATAAGTVAAAPPPGDAGRFAGALARRYSGTFRDEAGRVLPRVRFFEIWNEPNIDQFWTPQCRKGRNGAYVPIAARRYALLAYVASREIRRAQPDAVVIGGVAGPTGGLDDKRKRCVTGTESPAASTMVRYLRAEGVRLDAWSQHLYPIGPPDRAYAFPSWNSLPTLFTQLDKLRPNMPVYVTETGYHTSYNRFHRYFVSEQQQSDWLKRTMEMADKYPRVVATIWFNLQDNTGWTGGLYHSDMTPKPALAQYVTLAGSSPLLPEAAR